MRRWAYGYRLGEVELPPLGSIKQDACILLPREVDLSIRPPIAVDLGIAPLNWACPHADPHDPWTTMAGVAKRFACRPPPAEKDLLVRLSSFVKDWLGKNLTPLDPDSDTSLERWLEQTTYPLWRKEELRAAWAGVGNIRDKAYWECRSFPKDEWYTAYKHARAINSRSDEFKCYVGPMFKLIEEQVYKNPHFIKHVPVADRANYIRERLYRIGAKYYTSDYTSFEALFTRELMEAVEFQLYEYMTSKLPGGQEWMELVREVLGGPNRCKFRDFSCFVEATRMSGEMCTSLGNGYANLMIMLFMCELKGCTDVDGVVEGDDGEFVMKEGPEGPPTEDDFKKLGLIIKLESHLELSTASFCGLIFDEEDLLVVTDPRDVLVTFGWASARYARSGQKTLDALLRCKSLSLAHQYPGCPVISALAQYGLRITKHVSIARMYRTVNARKAMSGWERDQMLLALKDIQKIRVVDPPIRTRLLVERQFGITVEQQVYIESVLAATSERKPIPVETVEQHFPECWAEYASRYIESPIDVRRPSIANRSRSPLEYFTTCVLQRVKTKNLRWETSPYGRRIALVPGDSFQLHESAGVRMVDVFA